MAISHIASIRGSARMTSQQNRLEALTQPHQEENLGQSNQETMDTRQTDDSLLRDRIQAMRLPDSDTSNIEADRNLGTLKASDSSNRLQGCIIEPRHLPVMEKINSIVDIESRCPEVLSNKETLNRLEQKWLEITRDVDSVIEHLHRSTSEVSLI